jgi:hypothetical protein
LPRSRSPHQLRPSVRAPAQGHGPARARASFLLGGLAPHPRFPTCLPALPVWQHLGGRPPGQPTTHPLRIMLRMLRLIIRHRLATTMGRRRVEASIWACWQPRRPVFSEILPRRISKTISMKISVVSLSTENELVRNVLLAVLASLAKLEREKISQRMKAGLEQATGRSFASRSTPALRFLCPMCLNLKRERRRSPERDGRSAGGEWIRTSGSAMRSLIANSAALVEAA